MNIIVDAMGGDFAPVEIVKGCVEAAKNLDVDLTLVGKESVVREELKKYVYPEEKISVLHAEEVISGEDDPTSAIRRKKNSSMSVALRALADGKGDACVSAGNTGALISGATLIVKRIKGVRRVALAPVMPSYDGCFILVDAGANTECSAPFLAQFAAMGSIYMEKVMNIERPRVSLVNIGEEEEKGTPAIIEAGKLLRNGSLNYTGYIEARDIPSGGADVVVCDGFTGNVILKFMEGMGLTFSKMIKDIFMKNAFSKLSAVLVKSGLRAFKKKMDYTEYGGAPILGASKPVIKAHGNSKAKAFYHAVCQAVKLVENKVTDEIAAHVQEYAEA